LLIYAPSQKRAMEPANPPRPTIQYLFIFLPQSPPRLLPTCRVEHFSLGAPRANDGSQTRGINRRFFRAPHVQSIYFYWIVAEPMTPRQDPCQESSSIPATGIAVIRRTPSPSQTNNTGGRMEVNLPALYPYPRGQRR
jgi:hypothetical protein